VEAEPGLARCRTGGRSSYKGVSLSFGVLVGRSNLSTVHAGQAACPTMPDGQPAIQPAAGELSSAQTRESVRPRMSRIARWLIRVRAFGALKITCYWALPLDMVGER
jgi:hypothetical protein